MDMIYCLSAIDDSKKGDPKMIRLSVSMRTFNMNLQARTWKVPFGMRIRTSRYPGDSGLR